MLDLLIDVFINHLKTYAKITQEEFIWWDKLSYEDKCFAVEAMIDGTDIDPIDEEDFLKEVFALYHK